VEEVRHLKYKMPGRCCICGHDITITSFMCPTCKSRTEGEFAPCRFCSLSSDQLDFIEVFLKCRGNIKDMEKELGISYPTIRNRLEDALKALGLSSGTEPAVVRDRKDMAEILNALDKGDITPQEALKKLKSR